MNATLAVRRDEARLGEPPSAFSRRFGPPTRVQPLRSALMRQFVAGMQSVTVLFESERAVAIQCNHAASENGNAGDPEIRPSDVQPVGHQSQCRLFIGEAGWVVSLQSCSDAGLKALLRRI